jgi:hypothetical protein
MGAMVMEGDEAHLIEYGRVHGGKPWRETKKLSLMNLVGKQRQALAIFADNGVLCIGST